MKKIITALLFAGFLTPAFAQDDRRDNDNNQYNENYQLDNRHGENDYRHDADRENWHRKYRDGDDREYRDRDDRWRSENYYPEYENHEMMENYAHRRWMERRQRRYNRENRGDED